MTKVHVSDHALLRYIERKYGFDFSQFRTELESLVRGAAAINAFSVHVDGLKFCLAPPTSDGTVTIKTVLLRSMKPPHMARRSKHFGAAQMKKTKSRRIKKTMKQFNFRATFDEQAKVWVLDGDYPGLVAEAKLLPELFKKAAAMIEDLQELN